MDATQICLSKIAVCFLLIFCNYLKVENLAEISMSTHRILFDPSGCRYIGGQPGAGVKKCPLADILVPTVNSGNCSFLFSDNSLLVKL